MRVSLCRAMLPALVSVSGAASAQATPAPPAGTQSPTIQCADSSANGKIGSTPCTIFAKRMVREFPGRADTVVWNVQAFATRPGAESQMTPTSAVIEMDNMFWLLNVAPTVSRQPHALQATAIRPIPLPPAKSYEIIFAYVAVPPGAHSAIHVQSGPEAWYVLAGSQCVETPDTVLHIGQGAGGMVPADTPLYLVATGTTMRRAFFVIVHDAERPFYTEIDSWHPRGKCPTAGR
jgi:quercetin dioxygenase-like cupin family protein